MKSDLLIILVKNPVLGKAKTRLAATIGDESALEIYKILLERTRLETTQLSTDKVVYYSDFIDHSDLWDNDKYFKMLQPSGDLGNKISSAFNQAFTDGYQRVCIIGSDSYDLKQAHLESGFSALQRNEAVIGPAEDGGYYLLGISQMNAKLFEKKIWSTDTVASDTIKDFKALNLSYEVLPALNDIDTEADLGNWAKPILEKSIKP